MFRPLLTVPPIHSICSRCRHSIFVRTPTQRSLVTTATKPSETPNSSYSSIFKAFQSAPPKPAIASNSTSNREPLDLGSLPQVSDFNTIKGWRPAAPPHHLHIFAHRHNTHITLTDGQRQPIISISAGNIGFRKSARGTYDAGFQLGSYVMARIQSQGLLAKIQSLEVIMRDFGPGREALTKILLGTEGKYLRGRIVRVMDATRLKFGGTRGKKPRRLG